MTNATYQSIRVTRADFKVAIAFTKTVHIRYRKEGGVVADGLSTEVIEWREIEPHEVRETADGNFVVVAMCRVKRSLRHFRLDRITHYVTGTRGFELPYGDPNEVTDWWTIRSKSDVEVFQVELNTDGVDNPYPPVLARASELSGKVRAVVKAEGGVSIRRLRRKNVLAWG